MNRVYELYLKYINGDNLYLEPEFKGSTHNIFQYFEDNKSEIIWQLNYIKGTPEYDRIKDIIIAKSIIRFNKYMEIFYYYLIRYICADKEMRSISDLNNLYNDGWINLIQVYNKDYSIEVPYLNGYMRAKDELGKDHFLPILSPDWKKLPEELRDFSDYNDLKLKEYINKFTNPEILTQINRL